MLQNDILKARVLGPEKGAELLIERALDIGPSALWELLSESMSRWGTRSGASVAIEALIDRYPQIASEPAWYFMKFSSRRDAITYTRRSTDWAPLAILTQCADGYVREPAVKRLLTLRAAESLPFLVTRSSDWVAEVSKSALDAVETMLPSASEEVLFRCLAICALRRDSKRGQASRAAIQVLRELERRPHLIPHVGRLGVRAQRWILQRMSGSGDASPQIDKEGMKSPDPLIRLFFARKKVQEAEGQPQLELIRSLMRDPIPAIRLFALQQAVASGMSPIEWESLWLDGSARVRNDARFYSGKAGVLGEAILAFYRSQLPAPSAIKGLGEIGDRSDLSQILSSAGNPAPKIRAAVAYAVGRVGGREDSALLENLLDDPSPKVAREALSSLRRIGATLDVPTLQRLAKKTDPPKRVVLRAFDLVSRWDQLQLLLELPPSILATEELTRWMARHEKNAPPHSDPRVEVSRKLLESSLMPIDLLDRFRRYLTPPRP